MGQEKAIVLHPYLKHKKFSAGRAPELRLEEAVGLTEAITLKVIASDTLPLVRIHPGTYIGKGKIDIYRDLIASEKVDVVIIDEAITPIQQRNLEQDWKCKVIDRTELILEIFGERAVTKEGRLQVELATLEYQKSRLVRSWTHLERQKGGYGFMGGPGEKQIESDRRMINERITKLKKQIDKVKRTRALHRKSRSAVPYPIVALVGYTNAGKSTLFNYLTEAGVLAKDILFATLDPSMRQVILPSGKKMILSDTVGFISALPTELVAAFQATLEEVVEADIILHVRDISHEENHDQKLEVNQILENLGVDPHDGKKVVQALNKIDQLTEDKRHNLLEHIADHPYKMATSALHGEGVQELLEKVDTLLAEGEQIYELEVDITDGKMLAWIYDHSEVSSRVDGEALVQLTVKMSPQNMNRFKKLYGMKE